ncbi:alkylmercury lyase [Rhodococcus ruber]|uniref:alkylmercury lyase n=1 Tax=Rhodococcus ruber TaxID=1830 RepID=UPI0017806FFB|nr:alkylmercury lyase [Rhodococcus ruber]MBD8057161.1 alkylmercury lyase [Rhodococcus ruber]
MNIELLSVPDCPNVAATRDLLRDCLRRLGLDEQVTERVGGYPSPTILVDGADVMGTPATAAASCRLDVPTEDRILAALEQNRNRP